jgi:hypothetical protein
LLTDVKAGAITTSEAEIGECKAYIIDRKKALKGYNGANIQACVDDISFELMEFTTLLMDRKREAA